MKTIILVTAHGYKDPNVANVFLSSLKNVGYEGYIGLISNDLKLDYDKIIKIPWNEDETYFRSSRRLFSYLDFLKSTPYKFDKIITSGIRDVLFQKNPEYMPISNISIYSEHEGPTLGSCPYNSQWLKNSNYLDENIKSKSIICAEIMSGTRDGIIYLLEEMCLEAKKNERKFDLEDQAILNYLYWNNKLRHVKLYHNEYSPVYTVGYCPYIRMAKGNILNRHLDIPYIIHQYDRHINLC